MAGKSSGSKSKRKSRKALKDLDAKNDRKIRGGKDLSIIKNSDSSSNKPF
jgi:hypothetical protein